MNSPTLPGMSLETFIAGDFSAMEHNIQAMDAEVANEQNDEVEHETAERTTTEDILGRENGCFDFSIEFFIS